MRVKNETVEKLDAIAKKSGYTRNALIGMFLEYAAENCVIKRKTRSYKLLRFYNKGAAFQVIYTPRIQVANRK